MDLSKFSAFKYDHKGPASISRQRWLAVIVAAGLALVVLVMAFPFGALAFLVPLLFYLSAPKMLYVGPRYLICGGAIVYYGNVSALSLNTASGTLRLVADNDTRFTLERDKFPTNARKTEKIQRNRVAKFDKVSARLIERVRHAAPEVTLARASEPAR